MLLFLLRSDEPSAGRKREREGFCIFSGNLSLFACVLVSGSDLYTTHSIETHNFMFMMDVSCVPVKYCFRCLRFSVDSSVSVCFQIIWFALKEYLRLRGLLTLTGTWIHATDPDGIRLTVQAQADGVVPGVAQSLPLLSAITTCD